MDRRATVDAIRLRYYDERNESDTLRTVGFQAVCPCGFRGERRRRRDVARADLYHHKVEQHGHIPQGGW